jgi:DNA mismatch repair ATPase MutL
MNNNQPNNNQNQNNNNNHNQNNNQNRNPQNNQQNNQNNNQNRNNQNPQNNQNNSKNAPMTKSWAWQKIGGIILLVLIVIALARMDRGAKAPEEVTPEIVAGCEDGVLFNTETGAPCAGVEIAPVPEAAVVSPELSFDDAKAQYAASTIILGDACAVASKEVTYTAPVRVLVTNEGTADQAIVLGQKSVTLRPLRYATVSLKEAGTYDLSCNGVATVKVTVK